MFKALSGISSTHHGEDWDTACHVATCTIIASLAGSSLSAKEKRNFVVEATAVLKKNLALRAAPEVTLEGLLKLLSCGMTVEMASENDEQYVEVLLDAVDIARRAVVRLNKNKALQHACEQLYKTHNINYLYSSEKSSTCRQLIHATVFYMM